MTRSHHGRMDSYLSTKGRGSTRRINQTLAQIVHPSKPNSDSFICSLPYPHSLSASAYHNFTPPSTASLISCAAISTNECCDLIADALVTSAVPRLRPVGPTWPATMTITWASEPTWLASGNNEGRFSQLVHCSRKDGFEAGRTGGRACK